MDCRELLEYHHRTESANTQRTNPDYQSTTTSCLKQWYNDIKSEAVKVFLSVSAVCTFASWQDKATQLPKLGLDDFKMISQVEP